MNRSQKTILIIDDEQAIRNSFSDYLEDLGFKVMTAENGKIGINKFVISVPDLVMIDLKMPELDGIAVLEKISRISPNTPLIVISGTGLITDAIQALRNGAWDYLLKPVNDLAVLEHTITKALEKAELHTKIAEHQKNLEQEIEKRTLELYKRNEQLEDEINRRKKIENQLRLLLDEKEILIKEVHHRVKNNLAIIISIMNLKSYYSPNNDVKEVMLDCENRVMTMSLVHEIIYSNEQISNINLQDFIKGIISNILNSYENMGTDIKFNYDIDVKTIDFTKLISLGLIINEIITNSIKHAFKDITEPQISVIFKQINPKKLLLQISDNGIGLNQNTQNQKTDQIGLNLITSLIDQINGQYKINSFKGTEYLIEMPGA